MNNFGQPIQANVLNKVAKYSLALLWIWTGLTSIVFSPEIGYKILAGASITGLVAEVAIYAGGILDILLGLWLLTAFKTKLCCITQVSMIIVYTALLTFIDSSFWLHPFGPITKNIPIIVLIGYVYAYSVSSLSKIE
jgi:hypothetical protein